MSDPVRLRPPGNQLNPRCLGWWRTRIALGVAPIVLAGALAGTFAPGVFAAAVAFGVIGAAYLLVMPAWWYRVHRWEVTDSAVYTRVGFFWREWRIAPMSRIQTVDTVRGPLQQAFRLATVTVTTASARGAVEIRGLDAELAAQLAEELTQVTERTPGDAT